MRTGSLAFTAIAAAFPGAALADTVVIPVEICVQAEFEHREKFEELLSAAWERDFGAFRRINGDGSYESPPRFITLIDGNVDTALVFADWSGLQAKDEFAPVLDRWQLLYGEDDSELEGYRVFFARVRRSVWNDYAGEHQKRETDYLVHFDEGCDLKMIQETKLPYWAGRRDG